MQYIKKALMALIDAVSVFLCYEVEKYLKILLNVLIMEGIMVVGKKVFFHEQMPAKCMAQK